MSNLTPTETLARNRDAASRQRRAAQAAADKALGPRGCLARDLKEGRARGRKAAQSLYASWAHDPSWPTWARRWASEGREAAAWWAVGGPYQGTPYLRPAGIVRGTAAKWAAYARRLDTLAAAAPAD